MALSFLGPLAGGVLIGAAASLMLLLHGRVAGISGMMAKTVGVVTGRGPTDGRWLAVAFVAGLALGGLALALFDTTTGSATMTAATAPAPVVAVAGLLVGVGTQRGSGCTSGHGVCGVSRLSVRSIVATMTFMAAAMAVVFVTHHALAGGSVR
ncbi:MAG: YeeE/YedE family protein [Polyangiaceae bacterium]